MTAHHVDSVHTKRQGRKTKDTQGQGLLARPRHRSLKTGPGGLRQACFDFAPLRLCLNLILLTALSGLSPLRVSAQEVADTIRIKTRVVFLDALVKDKKTNLPISNLTVENFEVFDNAMPRNISYFTREGQARKPLALILILDLREDGAGRFLKKPEILKSMEDELAKLPPGDEVAIMAMDIGEDEQRLWLTEFTNERAKLAAALARVQKMCETTDDSVDGLVAREQQGAAAEVQKAQLTSGSEASATSAGELKSAESATQGQPNANNVVETETIKGRNGAVVTRTTTRDGSINVKRVNKDGDVTIEMNDIYDMAAAVRDAARKAEQVRPNSQVSIVWISDGIAPIFFEDRDATEQILIRNNVIFNSLTVELRKLFKFLVPIGKPVAGWLGLSIYGSAKYLAERSGGEAVKVGRVKDYGAGLSRIIGNLTARYSLGFTLAESETDDGRMHKLEVRVNAKDKKGKNRKLQVSSRQGYFMSTIAPKEAAARTQ